MKRLYLLLIILLSLQVGLHAASADWYLYFYSDTYSLNGDAGQFETTSTANVYKLSSVTVSASGINFCVHNNAWSTQYGWKSAGVTSTGVAVELASASGATGWLAVAAGTYDVTFNSSALTIQFDVHSDDSGSGESGSGSGSGSGQSTLSCFLKGGDLTMATYLEDWGAKFYYKDGTEGDVFDILESYGMNFARLRLYNAPSTSIVDGSTTYRTPIMTTKYPNGYPYGGPEDILNLAKRAKEHNMKICLTLNMTDYWSHATMQMIPAEWSSATTHAALCDSVYNFTYRYVKRMVDQGTAPEYVSVGNETNQGMLFQTTDGTSVS